MTFLDRFNSPKYDFMQNRSGGKIIKFQQNQALTSHFESFWSILQCGNFSIFLLLSFYVISISKIMEILQMPFFSILETLNFGFWSISALKKCNNLWNSIFIASEYVKLADFSYLQTWAPQLRLFQNWNSLNWAAQVCRFHVNSKW